MPRATLTRPTRRAPRPASAGPAPRSRRPAAAALLAVAITTVVALAATARAEDGRLELVTERVVVFKDGTCLVVKKATGTSDATGTVFTENVPDAAVLGTFWATPDTGRLLAMTAGLRESVDEKSEPAACVSYFEILRANEGRTATLELDDKSSIQGTIRKVLGSTIQRDAERDARSFSSSVPLFLSSRVTDSFVGELVALATPEGDVILPVARIRRLLMKDMTLERERKVTERRMAKRLSFRFDGGAAPRSLRVMYFRPGLRWIPTYRLTLPATGAPERRAQVRLQAEILNEAEDLAGVPVDLVVGVPNFRFRETVSPFVLEQALKDTLRAAAPQLMTQNTAFSNIGFSNRAGERRGPAETPAAAGDIEIPADITASQSQDLFTYSLPAVTLKRGERAAVPVFESDVPFRDVYTWDLQIGRSDNEAAPAGQGTSPLRISQAQVWHQVELSNGTGVPWTTGAVFLLEGSQPLAQELLTYTSPGNTVRVPVTVSVDLRGTFAEEETKRDLNALQFRNATYARIDKLGRVSLRSFRREAVDVEVTCSLGGRADSATMDGSVTLGSFRAADWVNYGGHPAVNNHSDVRFALRLEPGATLVPEIAYHFFTQR